MNNDKPKPKYRIRNWKQYNTALSNRGSLTIWIDQNALACWLNAESTGRRGKPRKYADSAIECCLTIREVYHLPLRQTQGLIRSIFQLLQIDLPVPHYSVLSRRARCLAVKLASTTSKKIKHLLFDSSGLKIFGEGEWKVKLHKAEKRRTWRKLHMSMDGSTHQISSAILTHKDVVDPRILPKLLKRVEGEVERVYADGAYDSRECYKAIYDKKALPLIPPREGSAVWKDEYLKHRNSNVEWVGKFGQKEWKKESGYHLRSLVETAFFGLKWVFSDKLRSRTDETQSTEAMIRCAALNRMTKLGMPDSYKVA